MRRVIAVRRRDARMLRVRRFVAVAARQVGSAGSTAMQQRRRQQHERPSMTNLVEPHLKIAFGILTWTPIVPSTSCVIATSPAMLVSW